LLADESANYLSSSVDPGFSWLPYIGVVVVAICLGFCYLYFGRGSGDLPSSSSRPVNWDLAIKAKAKFLERMSHYLATTDYFYPIVFIRWLWFSGSGSFISPFLYKSLLHNSYYL